MHESERFIDVCGGDTCLTFRPAFVFRINEQLATIWSVNHDIWRDHHGISIITVPEHELGVMRHLAWPSAETKADN